MRLFIGIELEKDLVNRLSQAVAKVARQGSGIRWVKPEQFHLTLRFLGETPPDLRGPLETALFAAASGSAAFTIEAGGVGAFPNLERPRVLFVPLIRGDAEVRTLSASVGSRADALGFAAPEEEVHPHVTLGRIKSGQGVPEAVHELREVLPDRLGKMKVQRFTLFESRLSPSGPEYVALNRFPLGAG